MNSGQLDLFLDSRAIVLANEIIDALLARNATHAAACLDRLRTEDPGYRTLGELDILCRLLGDWPLPAAATADIANAVDRLEIEVQPAALAAMGKRAADFLQSLWRELAEAARPHPYQAEFAQTHCAGLYLRCGDARAAAAAAESIPHCNDVPDTLHWLAVARHRVDGLEACRPPLFLLAWRAPERLPQTLTELSDPLLQRDWRAFQSTCDWLDADDPGRAAWFPAWYRVEHPGAKLDVTADSPHALAAQTFFSLTRLLDLERRGYTPALAAARAQLRDLDPDFFAFYMARREVNHR